MSPSPMTMTPRQRFHAVMNFQPIDRLPLVEWAAWWDQTIARWRGEGLPASAITSEDITRHFALEPYLRTGSHS